MRDLVIITSKQLQLGAILDKRVVPKLEGQVSFEWGLWDGPLKTSLVTM